MFGATPAAHGRRSKTTARMQWKRKIGKGKGIWVHFVYVLPDTMKPANVHSNILAHR